MTTLKLDRRMVLALPLGGAVLAGGSFAVMLYRMEQGNFDPRGVPSPLVGKPLPRFDLPAQPPGKGFTSADILGAGHPVLVNFFASWCVPCEIEQPVLMQLHQAGVPIWGIAYKDGADAASALLDKSGNPYMRLARDAAGRTAIDFGLYGVPETFFIDRQGIIRWRWAGPLTPNVVSNQLDKLRKKYG